MVFVQIANHLVKLTGEVQNIEGDDETVRQISTNFGYNLSHGCMVLLSIDKEIYRYVMPLQGQTYKYRLQ